MKPKTAKPAPLPFTKPEELQEYAALIERRRVINAEYEAMKARAAVTLSGAPSVVETDPKTGKSRIVYQLDFPGWILKATQSPRDAYTIPEGTATKYTLKAI